MSASGFHIASVGCEGAGGAAQAWCLLLVGLTGQVFFYGIAALVARRRCFGRSGGWLIYREVAWLVGWNVCSSGWQLRGFFVSVKVVLDVRWDLVGRDVSSVSAQSANMRGDLRDLSRW